MRLLCITICLAMLAALSVASGCSRATNSNPPHAASSGRPADANVFGGHWYKVFDGKCTWQEANDRCRAMGGYLACIESQEEQQFLASLANERRLYLGGTDDGHEGAWRWINGSPFLYTCWMSGQPNNYDGNEDYLATYDAGEWVDVAGDGEGFWMPKGFICEWDR